jgi:hypothetical protein
MDVSSSGLLAEAGAYLAFFALAVVAFGGSRQAVLRA